MLRLHVLLGNPGSGKSRWINHEIAANPGRHLVALPLIELLREQRDALLRLKPDLLIIEAHSQAANGQGTVAERLRHFAQTQGQHVVVLTTHEALLAIDTPEFSGWRLWIDEIPQGVTSGSLPWARVGHLLSTMFDLDPVGDTGWAALVAKPGALKARRLNTCPLADAVPDFRRFAARPQGVLVQAKSWKAAAQAKQVAWASVWSLEALRPFASATIATAGFQTSLMVQAALAMKPSDLAITYTDLSRPRTGQPTIRIAYFTAGHQGATTFWDTSEGRWCLKAVADYMTAHVPMLGFWSANEGVWQVMEHRIAGLKIGPRAIGFNSLRHEQSCALIYSSKLTPNDAPLQALLALDGAAFRSAREDEDIRQFVSRGAIRDPAYDGAYDVYLYSRDQAEGLAAWLDECGFHDVALVPLDAAGVMAFERPKKKAVVDPQVAAEEKRAKGRERKRRQRERDAAGQPTKPRGRPKSDGQQRGST